MTSFIGAVRRLFKDNLDYRCASAYADDVNAPTCPRATRVLDVGASKNFGNAALGQTSNGQEICLETAWQAVLIYDLVRGLRVCVQIWCRY